MRVPFISKHDWAVIVFVIVYSFVSWWPTRFMPYFWDSSGFFIHTTQSIYTSNFSSLVGVDTNFAHPTLMQSFIALMWKIFSPSILVSHISMFIFLPMASISLYFWLKYYTTEVLAFIGSVCFLVSPAVLAEFFNIYVDLPSPLLE